MRKKPTRWLSTILAVIMTASMLPSIAIAAPEAGSETRTAKDVAADLSGDINGVVDPYTTRYIEALKPMLDMLNLKEFTELKLTEYPGHKNLLQYVDVVETKNAKYSISEGSLYSNGGHAQAEGDRHDGWIAATFKLDMKPFSYMRTPRKGATPLLQPPNDTFFAVSAKAHCGTSGLGTDAVRMKVGLWTGSELGEFGREYYSERNSDTEFGFDSNKSLKLYQPQHWSNYSSYYHAALRLYNDGYFGLGTPNSSFTDIGMYLIDKSGPALQSAYLTKLPQNATSIPAAEAKPIANTNEVDELYLVIAFDEPTLVNGAQYVNGKTNQFQRIALKAWGGNGETTLFADYVGMYDQGLSHIFKIDMSGHKYDTFTINSISTSLVEEGEWGSTKWYNEAFRDYAGNTVSLKSRTLDNPMLYDGAPLTIESVRIGEEHASKFDVTMGDMLKVVLTFSEKLDESVYAPTFWLNDAFIDDPTQSVSAAILQGKGTVLLPGSAHFGVAGGSNLLVSWEPGYTWDQFWSYRTDEYGNIHMTPYDYKERVPGNLHVDFTNDSGRDALIRWRVRDAADTGLEPALNSVITDAYLQGWEYGGKNSYSIDQKWTDGQYVEAILIEERSVQETLPGETEPQTVTKKYCAGYFMSPALTSTETGNNESTSGKSTITYYVPAASKGPVNSLYLLANKDAEQNELNYSNEYSNAYTDTEWWDGGSYALLMEGTVKAEGKNKVISSNIAEYNTEKHYLNTYATDNAFGGKFFGTVKTDGDGFTMSPGVQYSNAGADIGVPLVTFALAGDTTDARKFTATNSFFDVAIWNDNSGTYANAASGVDFSLCTFYSDKFGFTLTARYADGTENHTVKAGERQTLVMDGTTFEIQVDPAFDDIGTLYAVPQVVDKAGISSATKLQSITVDCRVPDGSFTQSDIVYSGEGNAVVDTDYTIKIDDKTKVLQNGKFATAGLLDGASVTYCLDETASPVGLTSWNAVDGLASSSNPGSQSADTSDLARASRSFTVHVEATSELSQYLHFKLVNSGGTYYYSYPVRLFGGGAKYTVTPGQSSDVMTNNELTIASGDNTKLKVVYKLGDTSVMAKEGSDDKEYIIFANTAATDVSLGKLIDSGYVDASLTNARCGIFTVEVFASCDASGDGSGYSEFFEVYSSKLKIYNGTLELTMEDLPEKYEGKFNVSKHTDLSDATANIVITDPKESGISVDELVKLSGRTIEVKQSDSGSALYSLPMGESVNIGDVLEAVGWPEMEFLYIYPTITDFKDDQDFVQMARMTVDVTAPEPITKTNATVDFGPSGLVTPKDYGTDGTIVFSPSNTNDDAFKITFTKSENHDATSRLQYCWSSSDKQPGDADWVTANAADTASALANGLSFKGNEIGSSSNGTVYFFYRLIDSFGNASPAASRKLVPDVNAPVGSLIKGDNRLHVNKTDGTKDPLTVYLTGVHDNESDVWVHCEASDGSWEMVTLDAFMQPKEAGEVGGSLTAQEYNESGLRLDLYDEAGNSTELKVKIDQFFDMTDTDQIDVRVWDGTEYYWPNNYEVNASKTQVKLRVTYNHLNSEYVDQPPCLSFSEYNDQGMTSAVLREGENGSTPHTIEKMTDGEFKLEDLYTITCTGRDDYAFYYTVDFTIPPMDTQRYKLRTGYTDDALYYLYLNVDDYNMDRSSAQPYHYIDNTVIALRPTTPAAPGTVNVSGDWGQTSRLPRMTNRIVLTFDNFVYMEAPLAGETDAVTADINHYVYWDNEGDYTVRVRDMNGVVKPLPVTLDYHADGKFYDDLKETDIPVAGVEKTIENGVSTVRFTAPTTAPAGGWANFEGGNYDGWEVELYREEIINWNEQYHPLENQYLTFNENGSQMVTVEVSAKLAEGGNEEHITPTYRYNYTYHETALGGLLTPEQKALTVTYSETTATSDPVVATLKVGDPTIARIIGGPIITFKQNGSAVYTVKYTDGTTGTATATVDWIVKDSTGDTTAPVITGHSFYIRTPDGMLPAEELMAEDVDPTNPANLPEAAEMEIEVSVSDASVVHLVEYSGAVVKSANSLRLNVTENGTVKYSVADANGNKSEPNIITISNITTKPAPTGSIKIFYQNRGAATAYLTMTGEDVKLQNFEEMLWDQEKQQYYCVLDDSAIHTFTIGDKFGRTANVIAHAGLIDNRAPSLVSGSPSYSVTTPTKDSVTALFTFDKDVSEAEYVYSLADQDDLPPSTVTPPTLTVSDRSVSALFTKNCKVGAIIVTGTSGKKTTLNLGSYGVDWIDKTPPELWVSQSENSKRLLVEYKEPLNLYISSISVNQNVELEYDLAGGEKKTWSRSVSTADDLTLRAYDVCGNLCEKEYTLTGLPDNLPAVSVAERIYPETKYTVGENNHYYKSMTLKLTTNCAGTLFYSGKQQTIADSGEHLIPISSNGLYTFTLVDSYGNRDEAFAIVSELDNRAPAISYSGAGTPLVTIKNTLLETKEAVREALAVTATDDITAAANIALDYNVSGLLNAAGVYKVPITATDGVGNSAVIFRSVELAQERGPARLTVNGIGLREGGLVSVGSRSAPLTVTADAGLSVYIAPGRITGAQMKYQGVKLMSTGGTVSYTAPSAGFYTVMLQTPLRETEICNIYCSN